MDKNDINYFNRGKTENPEFFSRFNSEPSFKGLKVLDIGCGHGSLCLYMAQKGAKQVIGIDINRKRIEFAKKNSLMNYPQFKDIISFKEIGIHLLDDSDFDIIVSKDSFEHITHPQLILNEIYNNLKINGKAYIGFSPLYNAYNGDHSHYKTKIPWGHLIHDYINGIDKDDITIQMDRNLNMVSFKEYKTIFNNSKFDLVYFKVNQGKSFGLKLFNVLRKIPPLTEYFSYNLYVILKK